LCLAVVLSARPAAAVDPNVDMLDGLRPFHGLVGVWQGTGTNVDLKTKTPFWKENIEATWGFRDSDGRVSINFYIENGLLLDVALLTYKPDTKTYEFISKDKKGAILHFEGNPSGSQSLRLDRTEKGADDLDRIEIKLLRGGEKLRYVFSKKKGRKYHTSMAEVELFREGAPLESFKDGPKCIVTGGAGRLAVDHEGKTYHVACSATRKEFLDHAEKYIARAQADESK
jgi:hypothetical protein